MQLCASGKWNVEFPLNIAIIIEPVNSMYTK